MKATHPGSQRNAGNLTHPACGIQNLATHQNLTRNVLCACPVREQWDMRLGQEAVAPVLRGRILPGSRDSDRWHPARSGRLPGTVHPAGTCGPPTGGERVPGMQKQAGGESGQRRPPRAAAGWPPARGLLAAGGLRVIPKPRTPSSTRDTRSHECGPWVGPEQSPARAAGRVDGSRGSRQGLGVGAQGRLSPKCPSQRGPGDNRTGW